MVLGERLKMFMNNSMILFYQNEKRVMMDNMRVIDGKTHIAIYIKKIVFRTVLYKTSNANKLR